LHFVAPAACPQHPPPSTLSHPSQAPPNAISKESSGPSKDGEENPEVWFSFLRALLTRENLDECNILSFDLRQNIHTEKRIREKNFIETGTNTANSTSAVKSCFEIC
jgi:hypothetical protein